MAIEIPNTHPLYDPPWAEAEVQTHFTPQLALGREWVKYGADLLLRALGSGPDDLPNHVILSVLFRQAVAAADGVILSLAGGSLTSAALNARSLLEARWGLMLALKDPPKWGRHIYVASLREQRLQIARAIPGTPERQAYAPAIAQIGRLQDPTDEEVSAARSALDSADAVLLRPENATINAAFAAAADAKKAREPSWYYDGTAPEPERLRSLWQLASHIGCAGEYQSIYRLLSYHAHGGQSGTHLSINQDRPALQHIRGPEDWRQLYLLSMGLVTGTIRRIMNHYRPDEVSTFISKYKDVWRSQFQSTPDVQVILDRFAN